MSIYGQHRLGSSCTLQKCNIHVCSKPSPGDIAAVFGDNVDQEEYSNELSDSEEN